MITYREPRQEPLPLDAQRPSVKPFETIVYQRSTAVIPWAVGVICDKWGRYEVTIYHGELRDGRTRFCELKFDTAVDVVKFAESMLGAWAALGKRISYTGEDTAHLYDALRGVMGK